MSDRPKAVWSGEFKIGDFVMKVHVLDNGERVIEADSVEAFFDAEGPFDEADLMRLAEWMRGLQ